MENTTYLKYVENTTYVLSNNIMSRSYYYYYYYYYFIITIIIFQKGANNGRGFDRNDEHVEEQTAERGRGGDEFLTKYFSNFLTNHNNNNNIIINNNNNIHIVFRVKLTAPIDKEALILIVLSTEQ